MNFIQDNELVFVIGEVKLWLGEFGLVAWRLQIVIDRWSIGGDIQSERRLANLPRSQQGNRR
jgi:hypothetical protein